MMKARPSSGTYLWRGPIGSGGYIIYDDIVADLVRRGVENAARVQARELVNKTAPVEIGAEHKGVDLDASLGAALNLFECFLNDPLAPHRGAPTTVQPSDPAPSDGRRITVGNKDVL